jgi:hypothetical protein
MGETALMWLRRVVSGPLIVLAFACAIGAVRIFMHNLPDSTFGDGIFATSVTAAAGAAAFFLLRPDLRRLSPVSVREWCLRNPLGQATALYLVAAILMVAAPSYMLDLRAARAPGVVRALPRARCHRRSARAARIRRGRDGVPAPGAGVPGPALGFGHCEARPGQTGTRPRPRAVIGTLEHLIG